MAFRKQALPITFAGGVQTKQDAKQVEATQLIDLQNATFTKQTTLSKRNGYHALSRRVDGATTYANARGLAERDGELVLFTDSTSASYRSSSDTWSTIGDVASVAATTRPIARTGTVQALADSATNRGVTVVAWEDSRGGVWASVVEAESQRVLLASTALNSSTAGIGSVRVVAVGALIAILYIDNGNGIIYCAMVSPANPSRIPIPQILTDDLSTAVPTYDACPLGVQHVDPDDAIIAWAVAGGFRLAYLSPSGVIGSPVTGYPSAVSVAADLTGPISLVGVAFAGRIVVSICTSTTMQAYFCRTIDLVTTRTATTGASTIGAVRVAAGWGGDSGDGTPALWYAIESLGSPDPSNAATNYVTVGSMRVADSSLDLGATSTLRGHNLASRAFHDGPTTEISSLPDGDCYVAVAYGVKFFTYVAIVRLSAVTGFGGAAHTTCVARLLPIESTGTPVHPNAVGRGGGGTVGPGPPGSVLPAYVLPSVTEVGIDRAAGDAFSRVHSIPLGYRIQLGASGGDQFSEAGIKICSLDFAATGSYQSAQLGRGLYLAGACPSHYDGSTWAEAELHTAPDWGPEVGEVDSWTTTSGSLSVGTYLYKFWYEHVDAQGELHRSAVRSVEYVNAADEHGVTMHLPTYKLTCRDRVRIIVARSPVNQTGSDSTIPCYRVTGTDPTIQTDENAFVFNDPTVDFVTFNDRMSDDILIEQDPAYVNGGVLSNDPSPWAGGVIAGGKGRLYWTDPTDPNLVRFSQQRADETGLDSSQSLSIPIDPFGGAIVGITVMDDAVIVLKETAIYAFGGPGPDADGGLSTQNAFSPPQLVTSDVGCNSATSIAQTPAGVVFSTSKGIFLLSRDRQVASIGDPVYAYKDQHVTRATLLPDRHQVVFLVGAGRTLLWDYERNQWSTYTNHTGLDGGVIDGVYHYLRTDGRVFRETPGLYADDNAHIPMLIETAWIKMSGYLQGWQKIIHATFLGAWRSNHALRVRYRIDYQDAYTTFADVDVDSVHNPSLYGAGAYGAGAYGGAGGASGTVYQQQFHVNRRCQAISFQIGDIEATTAFGAAFELSEMLLSGARIGPVFKLGPGRQH